MAPRATPLGRRLIGNVQHVEARDGCPIAVHRLSGGDVRGLPLLLVSHATGFHAHCYRPMADDLAGRFDVRGLDHRGHGETPVPVDWSLDWRSFGDDARTVARALAPDGGVTGVGHSMGGTALLMAAAADAGLFDRLVLFEPVVADPDDPHRRSLDDMRSLPIVNRAHRRRARFASFEDAIASYREKPLMSEMRDDVLRLYVEHGFRPVEGGGVELRCRPEYEAEVFVRSFEHPTWALLPDVSVATTVVTGEIDDGPARLAGAIVNRLPYGELVERPELTHLGPFNHPAEFAAIVAG